MTIDRVDVEFAADIGGVQPVIFVPSQKQAVRSAINLHESSWATKYLVGPIAVALVAMVISVVNLFAIRVLATRADRLRSGPSGNPCLRPKANQSLLVRSVCSTEAATIRSMVCC